MRFVLDTNIFLVYLRDTSLKEYLTEELKIFDEGNLAITSVVTIGEIKSLALRNGWGNKRVNAVGALIETFVITQLNYTPLLNAYAEIDAFSQGRHPTEKLMTSSRNMGKNDLWIGATAKITDATLITTDKDFDHLDKVFFPVLRLEI